MGTGTAQRCSGSKDGHLCPDASEWTVFYGPGLQDVGHVCSFHLPWRCSDQYPNYVYPAPAYESSTPRSTTNDE